MQSNANSTPNDFPVQKPAMQNLIPEHTCPIHFIPEEILLTIVQLVAARKSPVQDLTKLTLLCRRWKRVIDGAPAVWSYITATEPLSCVKKALKMVQDVPIDLEYNEGESKYVEETFLRTTASRIAQWRSVVLLVSSYGDWSLGPLEETSPPHLETLHILRNRAIPMGKTFTLFGGQPAPSSLRDIRLHFVPFAVAPLRLSTSITTLELDGLVVVSVVEILRILQACPSLRVLQLGLLELSVPPLAELERYPEIHLPYLEYFQLRLVDEFLTRILLWILRFPNVKTLILPIQVDGDEERMLDFLVGPAAYLTSVFQRIISTADQFEMYFKKRQFTIAAAGLSVTWFTDRLDLDRLKEAVRGIFGHLGEMAKAVPTLLGIVNCERPVEWMVWLDSVLKVTALLLRQVSGSPDELLDQLSKPIMAENHPELGNPQSDRWLFPSLGEIHLYTAWPKHVCKVVEVVELRNLSRKHGSVAPVSVPYLIRELYVDQYPYGDWANTRVKEELGYFKKTHTAMDIYLNGSLIEAGK
ncbi:hypothetical protein FRB90_001484 [Tulasnella sp. 427]|nr:hypothetical protein FRB90_001484 [Tulasnella sp. 427]